MSTSIDVDEELERDSLNSGDSLDDKVLSSNGSSLVEAADVDSSSDRDPERLGAEDGCYKRGGFACQLRAVPSDKGWTWHSPYLDRAAREALTAMESSMGSSGGTTEVMMRTQSSRSLDFFMPFSSPLIQT